MATKSLRSRLEPEEQYQQIRVAVLISNKGTGSNAKALIEAYKSGKTNAPVTFIVSDKIGAPGLEHAKDNKIPYLEFPLPGENKEARNANRRKYSLGLARFLNNHKIQIAILAGFMTILDTAFFDEFKGITLNIHPGWIPDTEHSTTFFPDGTIAPWNRGMMTDAAIAQFDKLQYAGSTIHVATDKTDFGPVIERVYITKKSGEDLAKVYVRLKAEESNGMIRALQNPQKLFSLIEKNQ